MQKHHFRSLLATPSARFTAASSEPISSRRQHWHQATALAKTQQHHPHTATFNHYLSHNKSTQHEIHPRT